MLRAAAVLAILSLAPGAAAAGEPRKVAVGAVDTIGGEGRDTKILDAVETAIAELDSVALISRKTVRWRLRRAKKAQLEACEGESRCLGELGKAVGADWVVAVDIGGLGDVRLLHLKLVDASSGRALRSVTSSVRKDGSLEPGALIRLFEPRHYRGTLALSIGVEGASIFIDGRRVGTAPSGPLPVDVGTHALRVTHPEHRDYVRFVDVGYGQKVALDVELAPLGVVSGQLERTGGGGEDGGGAARPWYGRWWVITGVAVIAGGAALVLASQSGSLDFDRERVLGSGR